mmetsp:Transcript_25132/g.51895  ORF Transcript_25132/g.51895 Transcript_25132/m.51895 type:complete len:446 (+) Transcript_25132:144-1481(+)
MEERNLQEQDQERPRRPFTAYNIFFHLEKERVLQEQGQGFAAKIKTIDPVNRDLDMDAALRPTRYQHLVLPVKWYVPDPDKKRRLAIRKNRAPPHGIFTFVELSKMISSEWKRIDEETRTYCTELADEQLKLYIEEMKVFVDKYGAEAAKKSSKQNKTAIRNKKTAKAAGKDAGGAIEDDQGGSKLGDNIIPIAPYRDDQKCKGNSKSNYTLDENNGITILHLHQGGGGLQDPAYNCCSFIKDNIEPESLSSNSCDYISPMMSCWANKVVNGTVELGTDVSSPRFCAQSLRSIPGNTLLLHGHQAAGNQVNITEISSIESASQPVQRFEGDEHFGRSHDDMREDPNQVCNFDIKDFDWTWNPNPSNGASFAPIQHNKIDVPVQYSYHYYQDHQEFPRPAFQRRSSYQPYSLTHASSPATGVSNLQYPFHTAGQRSAMFHRSASLP